VFSLHEDPLLLLTYYSPLHSFILVALSLPVFVGSPLGELVADPAGAFRRTPRLLFPSLIRPPSLFHMTKDGQSHCLITSRSVVKSLAFHRTDAKVRLQLFFAQRPSPQGLGTCYVLQVDLHANLPAWSLPVHTGYSLAPLPTVSIFTVFSVPTPSSSAFLTIDKQAAARRFSLALDRLLYSFFPAVSPSCKLREWVYRVLVQIEGRGFLNFSSGGSQ